MRIRRKFLQLTSMTYPHGTEAMLEKYLPKGYKKDQFGNYYIKIGENPTSLFTCHLDTACEKQEKVNHTFQLDGELVCTDGRTILGADDKAGMIVVLHMIQNRVPGLYYFFLGEEVGCIGSKKVASLMAQTDQNSEGGIGRINKVVSFDRRGFNSVITHQFAGRCCSDAFAENLSKELNKNGMRMKPDNTGVCTDSIQFQEFISECTNISVGYFNEHTGKEVQNVKFLGMLCKAVCKIDWENLPTYRDPMEFDMSDEDEEEEDYFGSFNYEGERTFTKEFYSFINDVTSPDGKKKIYISKERVKYESGLIYTMMNEFGTPVPMEEINWNGEVMTVDMGKGLHQITRLVLSKICREFSFIDNADIRYELPTKTRRSPKKRQIDL